MSKAPSKSVFVGNIPYGLTEEQIIDIFSSAGKVLSFRLVYDRETGRPKGFGFAEYPDADSAASAVRNLNDFEIMNRKLRVDFSNDGAGDEESTSLNYNPAHSTTTNTSNGYANPITTQNGSSALQLPPGTDLPPGLTCPDAISRTLNTLPPAQLLDVLSQMKQLVTTDQTKATELLRQAPQLSYAIFQALLLMGLVSTEALASVVEQASAAPAVSVQAPTPQAQPLYPLPGQSAYPPAPGFSIPPPQVAGGTPPVHGLPYPPPPPGYQPPRPQPQASAPPPAAPPAAGLPDTEALVQQVLAMPQEMIDALPPADREQLLALRASFQGLR